MIGKLSQKLKKPLGLCHPRSLYHYRKIAENQMQNIYKISVSKSQGMTTKYPVHFYKKTISRLEDLAEVILHNIWSSILFSNDYRHGDNFIASRFLGLDFDEGMTIEKAIETFKDYSYIIGTTKNHRKDKTSAAGKFSPACDRFRVVLVGDKYCQNKDDYKYTLKTLINSIASDKSCKDAGRLFHPCKEIVAINHGKHHQWICEPTELKQKRKDNLERVKKHFTGQPTEIPQHLFEELLSDFGIGDRHTECYRLGAELMKLGYSEEEAFAIVWENNSLQEIGEDHVERAVSNGWHKASEELIGG